MPHFGLRKAMNRLATNNARVTCPDCSYALPSYPGRYPRSCPECDGPLPSPGQSMGATNVPSTTAEQLIEQLIEGEIPIADAALKKLVRRFKAKSVGTNRWKFDDRNAMNNMDAFADGLNGLLDTKATNYGEDWYVRREVQTSSMRGPFYVELEKVR